MAKRDYYEVLGVSRQATPAEIRRAYRRLARQYSPDVNLWDHRGTEVFQEIAEAYRVLADPVTRAAYDRLGHRAFGSGDPAAPRGDDLHYPVEIDLEKAIRGVSTVLEVTRQEPCRACGATGRGPASPCSACEGRGTVPGRARVAVAIPPGVDTGAQVRIRGEGHAAPAPGEPGDLVVITRVRPHPIYTRKGDNLYCEVPLTVPEAALGARIRVPTPDGPTMLTVPAGTQSGQVFRLRGKGCPRLDREGRGDLYVVARVTIPRNPDPTLESLFRTLARHLPEDPRAALWRHCPEVAP